MKLIIINGSPAAGKTTVAQKLHDDLPFSLLADIDAWRRLVSSWQQHRAETLRLAYQFTIAAVEAHIKNQHSVIVDKAILSDNSVIDALVAVGKKHGAEIYEFILTADQSTTITRAEQRRRAIPHRTWASNEKVLEFWHITQKLKDERPHAILIDTSTLTPEAVHLKIKNIVLN
jgi:adenylate kinase family enzyme